MIKPYHSSISIIAHSFESCMTTFTILSLILFLWYKLFLPVISQTETAVSPSPPPSEGDGDEEEEALTSTSSDVNIEDIVDSPVSDQLAMSTASSEGLTDLQPVRLASNMSFKQPKVMAQHSSRPSPTKSFKAALLTWCLLILDLFKILQL